MIMKKTTLSVMVAACFVSTGAMAQEAKLLAPVVVTATRVEQDSFDLPMSIDKVDKKDIQDGQLRMTLSESLVRVPGITAQNRTQMAQDPQISTRGFGSRSSFGVRGIRLYIDGIPLSMPDGIGNPGNIDLETIGSIEVLRGPFSAMYGNSSGGVIQLFTEPSPAKPEVSGDVMFGSFNTRRDSVKASGTKSGVEYLLNYSDYSSDGYREQSASTKKQATARLKLNLSDDTKLTTLISTMDQFAQDPGGLVRNEAVGDPSAFTSPRSAASTSKLVNTRVERSNTQIGFNLEKLINQNNSFNLITYAGSRSNRQYLYVAPTFGGAPNSRASDIQRDFYGTELRFTNKGMMLERAYTLTAGISAGQMKDTRMDINADNGVLRTIVDANLNRNENQTATNFDQYLQASLAANDRIDFHAGIRHTTVDLKFQDKQIDATKCLVTSTRRYCDTSGNTSFSKTTPVIGMTFKLNPAMNLYANFGQAFETPTLVEVSYDNATTGSGPNLNIKPSSSDNYEIGAKALIGDNSRVNVSMFNITTQNEIIINSTVAGRTSYQNAGTTKRTGAEMSFESALANNFSVFAAYTLLNASFDSAFSYSENNVAKGNAIPGTYKSQIYGELAWKHAPKNFKIALEGRYNSKVYVNDTNSDAAPAYTVFNLRASLQQELGHWRLTEYVRVDNLLDKKFIGSVRVNDYTNGRYFEPAPGTNWIAGVKATYAF